MPLEKKIIYFSSLSIAENRISLAGSVFNSFLVLIKASKEETGILGGQGKPGQPSVSSFTGTKKGCSTHLSALSSLHMLQKLVAESAVTMTTVQESPLLVEQYCDTEEVI